MKTSVYSFTDLSVGRDYIWTVASACTSLRTYRRPNLNFANTYRELIRQLDLMLTKLSHYTVAYYTV